MSLGAISYTYRDTTTLSKAMIDTKKPTHTTTMPTNTITNSTFIPILPLDELPDPFGSLGGPDLSDLDLRETAYEILVGACRTSARPLTFVSAAGDRSVPSAAPSLQRSLTSTAASKVKKALGLKSRKNGSGAGAKRAVTVGELMRVQMRISEQTDSRVRRAMLRISAGQLGRRIESIVLPLELLNQFKSSDFPTQREYESWLKRNLKVLEVGLLVHPKLPLDAKETPCHQLRKIIHGAYERPIEIGKNSEAMHTLRTLVTNLACRSFDGSLSEVCHWADGVPLNFRLYQILLEALFDVNEPASIIEEVDEALDLIKKTWVVLGIDQMLHNVCFSWILFHRYISSGQVGSDLLCAVDNLLLEIKKDAKVTKDLVYSKILNSVLSFMLSWAERSLLTYHETFYRSNLDLMQTVLSLGLSAARILAEDLSNEHGKRKVVDVVSSKVDTYIRSSVRTAFGQEREKVYLSKKLAKVYQSYLPVLCILAQDVSDMAFNEKEIYGPILQRWQPLSIAVAVATLHSCYGDDLKQFVSGVSELTPDVIQVLIAADKLEKDLVRMAVEDSVDSEDGGKAIIQEMTPYEAEAVIVDLVKSWIKTRVDRLEEWVDRNLQQEVWNPRANREHFAPSAVEVLRIIDETLDAFFLLPIPMHPALLPELMSGLDKCVRNYISKAKSGSGSRSTFLPSLPSLTRCRTGSVLFKKKDKLPSVQKRKMNGDNSFGIPQICVRINTLHYIRKNLEALEKRAITNLSNNGSETSSIGNGNNFELSSAACVEGVQQLCEAAAYKVIFHDLSHVLWDGLYVGEVYSSRIDPFLQELEQNLVIISETVHDRIRTRVITEVMKASFDGFLLVLLAGGPSRSFSLQDSAIIEEDFKFLMDMFWSNGDGLPANLIDRFSTTVKSILPLFRTETESLIDQFKSVLLDSTSTAKTRLPLPPTSGHWSPAEPNTILQVLCHRNDKLASKFLKKSYNLPKRL